MIKPRLNIDFSAAKRRMFINANNEYSPSPNEFLFNHNRSALLFILKFLNISGKNVAVMAYNCHTVMNAIHQAGGHPIFIDVDRSLRMDVVDLKKKSKKVQIDAIIVTHLFGIPNDIAAIRNILDVPIIEDCAHAYLSSGCGEKGDFAVYSIGQGKFPSIGDGGICIINNPNYIEEFSLLFAEVRDYSYSDRLSLFLKLTIKHLCYTPRIYSILKTFFKKRGINTTEHITVRKMDKGIATIYNNCISELEGEKADRQRNASIIIKDISGINIKPLISPVDSNCFMVPLLCDDINLVHKHFVDKGVESAPHFKKCIKWAKYYGYKDGDCPNTERLIKKIICVPCYDNIFN